LKAVVLCAGLGTRLRPLTEQWPKPAIPVLGQPLLRYAMALLRSAGVDAVGVNVHHLAKSMEAVALAEAARASIPIRVSHEPIIQGTAGGIRGLSALVGGGEDFVVMNGDVLFSFDLRRAIESNRQSGAAASMILMPMPAGQSYASVEVDQEGGVRRIAGRGPGGDGLTPWHFTGVHLMTPAVLDFISPQGPEDINREVYPRMLQKGLSIRGLVVQGEWFDLGTPAHYLAAQLSLLKLGRLPAPLAWASPFSDAVAHRGDWWARDGARVEGTVIGPAFFDSRSALELGATVGPWAYVGCGASVGRAARVRQAVVLEDTRIAAGEDLFNVVAWRGHRIPAGAGMTPETT
jgi:mannose-1-phosphate guanylyltransferase